ncbi:MAG: DUF4157 domain-containing protein [Kofleriaceae bacterium]
MSAKVLTTGTKPTGMYVARKQRTSTNPKGPERPLLELPTSCPTAQCPTTSDATLRIGAEHDALEHEADRVADQVVGTGPAGAISTTPDRPVCSSCDHDATLQRSSVTGSNAGAAAPAVVHDVLRGPGQPFDRSTRSFYESRFRQDFGGVRIHTDDQAARSARSVDARAYTVGQHIVFDSDTFAPHTKAGRRLIAHELTHVAQQRTGSIRRLQRDKRTAEEPAVDSARTAALAPVVTIEKQWKKLKKIASGYTETSGWLAKGDTVVTLIREHTTRYLDASAAGDTELVNNYKFLLEGDMVAYRYVVWHAFVYQNLARLRPKITSLISAFDKDSTHYTGRDEADAEVRLVKKLLDRLVKDSATALAELGTTEIKARAGQTNEVTMTATSASDKRRRPLLEAETTAIIQVQVSVQTILNHTNKFLRNATWEGVKYAAEAVKEFIEVCNKIIDGSSEPEYDDKAHLDGDDDTANENENDEKSPAKKPEEPAPGNEKPADEKPADEKPVDKGQKKKKGKDQGPSGDGGGSGKWMCYGQSAVLQIPNRLPAAKCPDDGKYLNGPSVKAPTEDLACAGAKAAFNTMMKPGCKPKHVKCRCEKVR